MLPVWNETPNLVLQTMEITSNVVVCVNLMDEAKKKKITIDLDQSETSLGVPVIATTHATKKAWTPCCIWWMMWCMDEKAKRSAR